MKKFLASAIVALCTVTMLFSGTVRDNQNFTAEVNFDSGCIWKIKGVTVNVTAAQLNYLTAGGLPVSLLAIASNKMIIGDATGAGAAVTLSGDVLSTIAGVMTIQPVSVGEGDIILTEDQMLFGDGGTGVAAVVSGDVLIPKTGIAEIQPVSVAEGDVILTEDQMLFGDGGTGVAAVVSGDVLIPKTGIAVIQPLAVTEGDIVLTEDEVLIGDGGTGTAVVISGDVLIPKTGVAAIQDLAVEDSNIALTDAYLVVGNTGTGSEVAVSGDISMSNLGAFTVDEINSIAVATVTAGAALGATSAQNTDVWGSSGVTTSTVAAVATAAIQTKTVAGGNLAEYRVLRVWLGDTSMGVASTNNITSLVLSGGAAVETKTAEADYIYLTGADGTASAAVTGQAAIDKYIMVEDGSSVSATKITFEP